MAEILEIKKMVKALGFMPSEGETSIWVKTYSNHNNYRIKINIDAEKIDYGEDIKLSDRGTSNFKSRENFVVLECVNRLLQKGYKPQNIILEKTWSTGHGTSGKLDILVTKDDGTSYLMIECKTYGIEFDKEFKKILKNGGQIFTYFQQDKNTEILMLYSSELDVNGNIQFRNELIKIEEDYRQTGNVKDFYDRWNKLPKNNGIFDPWIKTYDFQSKALTPQNLKEIGQEDSGFIFNQFLEILRHNAVSDKPNAFNKIFTLFLCKIYDEKVTKPYDELAFQWFYTPYQYEGINYPPDDDISFQKRLTDLYKKGMKEFLGKEVIDISDVEFERKYGSINEDIKKAILNDIVQIRLKKNNEFSIKEVFDDTSFNENAKLVKEVVELLQGYKIRYTKKHQYLSDFFELLLTTGLKQESGQFFTPVPVAQFIIKSIPIDKIIFDKLKKGERENLLPRIIDYAAGSGHFITESMHEMQRIIDKLSVEDFIDDTAKKLKSWKADHFNWAEPYVYGIEKDYRLVKVSQVGCYLHGDGVAQIIHGDGLANFANNEYKGLLRKSDKDFLKENKQFDIVISNPPYSVSGFKNNARKYYTENDFEIYDKLTDQSSEIECLFIERTKQLLRDGGIAGIILPSSILSNTGIYTKAREIILEYFEIIAIAELGSNTFMSTSINTVILFLRRRNNYESKNIRLAMEKAFLNKKDITINQIENPISKYIGYVWSGLKFEDYITFLARKPNGEVEKHEIYKEYKTRFKNDFWDQAISLESEKLFYFILTLPQKLVLIKTDEEKQFLGYEFSNRRGKEGIHSVQKGKTIDECTKLFDPEFFDNPQKASTYIYKAFQGDFESKIDESLENNIMHLDLADMLTFDRPDFEKTISLSAKKKVKIDSKWEYIKLADLLTELQSGNRPKGGVAEYKTGIPSLGGEHIGLDGKISLSNMKYVPEKYFSEATHGVLKDCDILICKDGTLTGKIALFRLLDFPYPYGMVNEHLFILRTKDIITQQYLFTILFSKEGQKILKSNITGQAQGGLNRENLLNIKIPLPPSYIQTKMILEIQKIDNLEQELKSQASKLQNDLVSVMKRDGRIESYKFSEIASLEYGKPLNKTVRVKGEYPVMGSNGIDGTHNEYLVEGPCIIIGRKGSAGKVNFVEENCYPIDTSFYLKNNREKLLIKYAYYLLKELNLEEMAKGTGIGVPGLNRNNVHNLKISIHPISTQNQIVIEIEKIEKDLMKIQQELSLIPNQKEIILKQYLQ